MPGLGIDLGTTSTKAIVIDDDGALLALGESSHPFVTPQTGWAEQDPADWWRSACAAIRQALASVAGGAAAISAVGLCGQMHGLVLLDDRGATLRPCILWNDQRAARECAEVLERLGVAELVRRTGNTVHPGFSLPKLLWVRRHEPQTARAIRMALLPKDWLAWRLTARPGESAAGAATDCSDASGTALFDCAARRWSGAMLGDFAIDPAILPAAQESTAIIGNLAAEAAAATGLREGTPVVAGAGDQAASALGMGVIDDGAVSVTIGTSGVVFAARRRHAPDAAGRLHAFCHALEGRWHQMGVMLSAGGSLRWFRDALAPDIAAAARAEGADPYDRIAALAEDAPPGAEGVTFLPYLSGERTPHADPLARGSFCGLALHHDRRHLARAVFEGIAFGLADSLELIRATGTSPTRLRLAGGAARSPFWRQLCADVFGCSIEVDEVGRDLGGASGALGAAVLALVGAGRHPSVEAAIRAAERRHGRRPTVVEPRPIPALAEARERFGALAAAPLVRRGRADTESG
ncbi:MAG TPA: xylulokinase [Phycisphaerales bacterium]|nr:xylulokinase [Phycisphaerales bacterium]HMP36131.1 xylulokinase [Phycisphaerales bacterium]